MENKEIMYSLTEPQKRIMNTQAIYPNSSMFNIGGTVTIYGTINVDILAKAINNFVLSQDAFKIRVKFEDGRHIQYFNDDLPEEIPFYDFSKKEESDIQIEKWIDKVAKDPFIIENKALYKFYIFRKDVDVYGYVIKMHHVISDGWSFQMLTNQIKQNYEDLLLNLGQNEINYFSYKEFILSSQEYLNSKRYEKDKQYWNDMFSSLQNTISLDVPSTEGKRKSFFFRNETVDCIHKFCNENQITINSFFISIYILFKYKSTNEKNIVIGNPVLGRSSKKERLIFGMFVSSMPFRHYVNEEDSILGMVKEIDRNIKRGFIHQIYPFNHLVKDLNMGIRPLYTECINYYGTHMSREFCGYKTDNQEFYNGEQQYNIQLIIRDWSFEGLQIDVDYKKALYTEEQIKDMIFRIEMLMEEAFHNQYTKIKNISLLTQNEKNALLDKYNETYYPYNNDKTIIDLFIEQAMRLPDKTAIKDGEKEITYRDLNLKSDRLAFFLSNKGVERNTIVAIVTNHSIETLIGILAILKAGGAYLPIDPKYPSKRISYILREASVKLILTNLNIEEIEDTSWEIISIDDESNYKADDLFKPLEKVEQDDLAYVIYTSGSTGTPKGVMIDQSSLINYVSWAKRQYTVSENDIFPLFTSLSFDLTITSIYLPLITGGCIAIYYDTESEHALHRILKDNICTIMKLTPAHMRLIKESNNRNSKITRLVVGGENLKSDLANDIYMDFGEQLEIFNEYGPTEATVGCMIHKYEPELSGNYSVPIGKPIDNTQIFVLDENLNPVPLGWKGELYISGKGLARGYLNRPELTAAQFIKTSLNNRATLYRTGDLVRFIGENCIEYIRRNDDQLKLNGYRIETKEIECCMEKYVGIEKAVIIPKSIYSTTSLHAYYLSSLDIDKRKLLEHLSKSLPDYMIPTSFNRIDTLPLTINGKIDLEAIAELNNKKIDQFNNHNDTNEALLADVLSEILGVPVELDQNFFSLGGDSIKALQASALMNEHGAELKVKDILSHPTIRDMAYYISKNKSYKNIGQGLCEGEVPLTPIIEWFLDKKFDNPNRYCQSIQITMTERWEVEQLQFILNTLISHHDVLRLCCEVQNRRLYFSQNTGVSVTVTPFDIQETDVNSKNTILRKHQRELIERINIEEGRLVQSDYFHFGESSYTWMLVIHHIAVDVVSWHILVNDIRTLMRQIKEDKSQVLHLPEKTHSFKYWAEHANREAEDYNSEWMYWNKVLKNQPELAMNKFDEPWTDDFELYSETVDVETTNILLNKANTFYHTKTEELLIAALTLAMSECFQSNYFLLELEKHGRNGMEEIMDVSRTVGWFTYLYPIGLYVDSADLDHHLKNTKEAIREVPHNGIGYGLCKSIKTKWKAESQWCRFNYIGELNTSSDVLFYDTESVVANACSLQMTSYMEAMCYIQNKRLELIVRLAGEPNDTDRSIVKSWRENIKRIVSFCENQSDVTFTPSDFDALQISQEELDSLFDI